MMLSLTTFFLKRNRRLVYLHCKAGWHHVFWPFELRRVNPYSRLNQQRGLAVGSVTKTQIYHLVPEQPPRATHQAALGQDQSTAARSASLAENTHQNQWNPSDSAAATLTAKGCPRVRFTDKGPRKMLLESEIPQCNWRQGGDAGPR